MAVAHEDDEELEHTARERDEARSVVWVANLRGRGVNGDHVWVLSFGGVLDVWSDGLGRLTASQG